MLTIFHVTIALVLSFSIILQQRTQGITASFGTGTYVQRRGAERLLYQGTIVSGILFFLLGVVRIFAV